MTRIPDLLDLAFAVQETISCTRCNPIIDDPDVAHISALLVSRVPGIGRWAQDYVTNYSVARLQAIARQMGEAV